MGKLTALQMKSLVAPGRYSDGDGLILKIGPTGGRSWILRIQMDGRRRDIGLGDAKLVSLKEAREAAGELRKLARSGVDPLAERRRQMVIIPTFREACKLVHAELSKGWKNGKHNDQWLTTLENYAWSRLGALRVNEIEGPLIRDVLAEIWLAKPETARRVKQRIGVVLDWCYAKGFRPSEAPMRSLSKGLPRQPKKDGHFEAMPYEDVPAFLETL
ncbi:MAG: tyrosine-type recombinase/integrase, partial [Sphingobium sp.]